MEPTIHCARAVGETCRGARADLVLEEESGARFVHRGDIISFRPSAAANLHCSGPSNLRLAKRVIGMGGDRVREKDGVISVNGRLLAEPYVPRQERDRRSGSWVVPKGSFFVMGDNRAVSCDSSDFGAVPASRVLGRAVEIIRPATGGFNPVGPPVLHVHYPYDSSTVPTASMEPTIHCARPGRLCEAGREDLVLTELSGSRSVRRGDIVSFILPAGASRYCGHGSALERVIGLPGEHITEDDGFISIDGKQLEEPYVPASFRDHHSGSWNVPASSYFVMADFRAHSCDSRLFGPVPATQVEGRAVEIIRVARQRSSR